MKRTDKLKISELNLIELNSTKDKFFSIIAHDLKNPLGSFREITTMLHDSYKDFTDEELKEFLELMKKSSDNIYSLLENLLEWSRSQRGKIIFDPVEINLYYITDSISQMLSTSANNKKISIINNIKKTTIIKADVNLLNTILRNLISNAIKFTHRGGKIEIGVEAYSSDDLNSSDESNSITIYIKDSGIGMNHDLIDRLFSLERNVSTTGTSDEKGTGLGLILCKEFVEKHGGKIWVESEEGKGSTFYFTLCKLKKNTK